MAQGARREGGAREIARLADGAAMRALAGRVAVLPLGAIEQHGPHLPVSTDAEIAAEIARRVCGTLGYALLPPLPYGTSLEHAPRLQVSLSGPTLRMAVRDIAASVADAGARALVVINAHHGNMAHLARLPRSVRGHTGAAPARLATVNYWRHSGAELGHAGHTETSVMLALGPVDMSRARKGYTEPPSATPRQRGRTARLAARSFLSVAPGGVWGDPRGATRADGERLLAEFADGVASECVRLFGGRRRPMSARRR
ncbi:MAG: creatininase family protein [Thaumarchaeota archaeon]|nr:creatininase family protein [Nitrososphaerota archaeon]MDD9842531.1 creatininase family protein [Nitrososphaerota archaeon]